MARAKKKAEKPPETRWVGVWVRIKPTIPDGAGAVTLKKLQEHGFEGVAAVHVGKYIEVQVPANCSDTEVEDMCRKLLANPIIEQYHVGPPVDFTS